MSTCYTPYLLYCERRKQFIAAMRNAIYVLLTKTYGKKQWWDKGVKSALTEEQHNSFRRDFAKSDKSDDRRVEALYENAFPAIVGINFDDAFKGVFSNRQGVLDALLNLKDVRNRWAHELPVSDEEYRGASEQMARIMDVLNAKGLAPDWPPGSPLEEPMASLEKPRLLPR